MSDIENSTKRRRDFDSLRDTASGVSARLDTAIGRLRIVLGDEA